jgi:hypothetical protein
VSQGDVDQKKIQHSETTAKPQSSQKRGLKRISHVQRVGNDQRRAFLNPRLQQGQGAAPGYDGVWGAEWVLRCSGAKSWWRTASRIITKSLYDLPPGIARQGGTRPTEEVHKAWMSVAG